MLVLGGTGQGDSSTISWPLEAERSWKRSSLSHSKLLMLMRHISTEREGCPGGRGLTGCPERSLSHSVAWCGRHVGGSEGSGGKEMPVVFCSQEPPCLCFFCLWPPSLPHITLLSVFPQPEMLPPSCDLRAFLGSSTVASLCYIC